ncbi:YHYH domain-containing protein [bacterium]|nr:YHYH domain-containing protein [bacterium]
MKNIKIGLLIFIFIVFYNILIFAHPGRTDSSGGHYVRTSGWGHAVGSYHKHGSGSSMGLFIVVIIVAICVYFFFKDDK